MPASRVRLGVDIGGTFTDAMILDEETGEFLIEKVPTTPSDLSDGFHAITTRSLAAAGRRPRGRGLSGSRHDGRHELHHRREDGARAAC